MRKIIVSACLIALLLQGFALAVPETPTQPFQKINQEQEEANQAANEELDELTDPTSETQPNGSDIKPDKVYSQAEYEQIYRDLEVPTFRFIHDVDPDQYYDMKDAAWSPYPLMRLNSPIYFKSITIMPGYYLLTPRQYKGDWYILFKEAGKVKYIIPTYDREIVPVMFYDDNLPQPKLAPSQKVHLKLLDIMGKFVPSAKREPTPQTYLETTDLDNNFVSIVIYWGNYRYYTIFRTIRL